MIGYFRNRGQFATNDRIKAGSGVPACQRKGPRGIGSNSVMTGRTVFALALAAGLGAAGPSVAADRVDVSVFQSVSDAGIYIARERGYFREAMIDLELIQLDSATIVDTALASGQVDVAGGSPSAGVYNAIRQGIPIRIVADKGSMPPGNGYIGLVIRKELEQQVKTPADLKRRAIAWAGYGIGGTNEVALDHWLRQAGLQESDLKVQNLTFGDSMAALGTGNVAGAYLIEPLMHAAVARGIGKVMTTGDKMYPNQQVAVLMVGPNFWQKRPEVAKRFMVAYLRGVRDYNDAFRKNIGRTEIVGILAKNTTVKQRELYGEIVLPGLNPDGAVNAAGMRDDMQWFVKKGLTKEAVDMAQVVDSSFVAHAVQQLGPYK
jgi:ABC-type nitrate/sulfonate/bicarbonate transport system substrate-binding protein